MKLNLNGWKKVSSHKDHSILKNKEGHELKVVHKALSKDVKNQLDKLSFADGGSVVEDKGPKIDPKKAKEMQEGATESGWQPSQWVKNVKEGLSPSKAGGVKMAEGGVAEDPNADMSEDTETNDATETPEGVPLPEGGMNPEELAQDNAETVSPEPTVGFNPNSASSKALAEQEALKANATAGTPTPGVQAMDPNSPAGPAPANPMEQMDNSLKREGQLRADSGKEQEELFNRSQKAIDQIHANSQAVLGPMQKEILSIAHDKSEDKIDENAYWKDHSRIFSAIGLALSTAGGQGEAAMNFLNKAIDRNIDAQKSIIKNKNDKRQTLLGALQKQYGDGLVAENMAKASEAASYLRKAQVLAAKSGGSIAQEGLRRMSLDFQQRYMHGVDQAAIIHAADKAVQSRDPESVKAGLQVLDKADPKRASSIRARLVGSDIADRPVSRFALQDMTAKTNLIDNVKQLRSFVAKHPLGTLDQDQKKYISGLALETQGLYRKALGASTSENEQHLIEKIIPEDPSSVFAQFGRGSSLRALDDSVERQLNNLKKQHGLPEVDYSGSNGPETKELGGNTYQKVGPNKWQKIK